MQKLGRDPLHGQESGHLVLRGQVREFGRGGFRLHFGKSCRHSLSRICGKLKSSHVSAAVFEGWLFLFARYTGFRQGAISFSGCVAGLRDQCPSLEPTNILIGRTEYNIMMFDSRADGRRWNISFFDYSSNLAGADLGRDYGKSFKWTLAV